MNDTFTVNEDSAANTLDVLDNDSFGEDGPGIAVAIVINGNPANGTATVNNNGTASDPSDDYIQYSPNPGFNGGDSLMYTLADSNGTTDDAGVSITVNADGNAPVAGDDSFSVDNDSTDNSLDVLNNDDFGPDGPGSAVAITISTIPANGEAMVDDNGTPADPTDDVVLYTPDAGFIGYDSFTYQLVDSDGTADSAEVTVGVGPGNEFDGIVWDSETVVFTKENFADIDLPENQDRITENVWITRPNGSGGLYNAKQEQSYIQSNGSPVDTEWALGTLDQLVPLDFGTFNEATGGTGNTNGVPGKTFVVHLITDNIYFELTFISWSRTRDSGGGFSYERTSAASSGN